MTKRTRVILLGMLLTTIAFVALAYLDLVSTGGPTWDVAIALILVGILDVPFGWLVEFAHPFPPISFHRSPAWAGVKLLATACSCMLQAYCYVRIASRLARGM